MGAWVAFFFFLILGCASPHAEAQNLYLDSYGEMLTLESEGGYAAAAWVHGRAQVFSADWLPQPYVGSAWDHYAPKANSLSRYSPLVGVELRILPEIKFFAEYRYVTEVPRTGYARSDPRFGLVGGLWREESLRDQTLVFWDSYAELISVSRIALAPTFAGFGKFGIRQRFPRQWATDLFTEFAWRESSDTNLGRRTLELRYGGRLVLVFGQQSRWQASLGSFRRFHTFREAPAARWRFIFVVGGSL